MPNQPSEDKTFLEVKKLVEEHKPVFIFREKEKARDVCILYIAAALQVPVIKIGLERIGPRNDKKDILKLVRSCLKIKGDRKAFIWVKNIHILNFDIIQVTREIVNLVKGTGDYLVFSGVYSKALKLPNEIPYFLWSSVYCLQHKAVCTTIYGTGRNRTRLVAKSPLHFRTYNTLFTAAKKFLGEVPDLIIENESGQQARFSSIIETVSLGISLDNNVFFSSSYPFEKHQDLMDVLVKAWETEMPCLDMTQLLEGTK